MKALFLKPTTYGAIAVVALIAAAIPFQVPGLLGMALGLGSATFNMAVWWWVTGLISNSSTAGGRPILGPILIVLALLFKLPLYVLCWLLANRIGAHAPGCFLGGIGLVYCSLFGWVLAKS